MLSTEAKQSGQTLDASRPLSKALRVEWLGQTIASLCWISSVFVYGLSSAGDWLQLLAASAWFVANLAALGED